MAQIDKVVQARGDLERANARFLLAIRDKLTPDQWKQLKDAREEGGMREEKREEWRRDGNGRGMRGPGGQEPGGPGMQLHRRQMTPPQPPPAGTPAPASGSGSGAGDGSGSGDEQ